LPGSSAVEAESLLELAPKPWFHVAVALCFLFGLAARVWIFTGGLGEVNADEALVGLMALHLLDGEWNTFFWGQSYGGTIDVILLAPVVAVLGATRLTLQVVPFLQSIVATVLVWLVARRVLGRSGGLTAAALFWAYPAAFVWWQTRQSLLYLPIVILGLVIVLCVLRIADDPSPRVNWFALGLAAGLGWWTSPQILYFLLPAVLWLLWQRPRTLVRSAWVALSAFVLGAGPWIVTNVVDGWVSITNLPEVTDGPWARLTALAISGLPMSLGLKVPFTEAWIAPVFGPILYLCGLVALAAATTVRRPSGTIHIWLLLGFPILFTLIPAAAYIGSGRYFFLLAPTLAMTLSGLARRDTGLITLIVVAVTLTAVGLFQIRDLPVGFVPEVDPLVDVLEQEEVDHVVAGFWLAYKLTWETEEEIIATPVGVNRYPPYSDEVGAADSIAYVYNLYEQSQQDNVQVMREALEEMRMDYDEITTANGYAVLIPEDTVTPGEVPNAAVPLP
jgi:hypothetical protein